MARLLASIRERALGGLMSLRNRRVLDAFVRTADAAQNAVDVFRGEWVSAFPAAAGVKAGDKPLFDDPRLRWMAERVPPAGLRVLELGPLEGAHTHTLLEMGAASVTAIEANSRAFLKCLVTKEVLDLRNARFLCADFMAYLDLHPERYDLCVASGVLYHMSDPLGLISLLCARADAVYLWTHYYDEDRVRANAGHAHRFGPALKLERDGFRARGFRRSYGAQVWNPLHLGGEADYSVWLTRDDILAAFKHGGLGRIDIGHEEPDHPAGPAFALVARRF